MNPRDERIGKFVQKMRGDMSQKQLAEEMRSLGWKWTQTTVWNIEKGDRPLRLSEAEDLVKVTNHSLVSFLGTPETFDLRAMAREIDDLAEEIKQKFDELQELQLDLALLADATPEAINNNLTHTHITSALELSPSSILEEYELSCAAEAAKERTLAGEPKGRFKSGPYGQIVGITSNADMGYGEVEAGRES